MPKKKPARKQKPKPPPLVVPTVEELAAADDVDVSELTTEEIAEDVAKRTTPHRDWPWSGGRK